MMMMQDDDNDAAFFSKVTRELGGRAVIPASPSPETETDDEQSDPASESASASASSTPDVPYTPEDEEALQLIVNAIYGSGDDEEDDNEQPQPEPGALAESESEPDDEAPEDEVLLGISPRFGVILRSEPGRLLCHARLGPALREETLVRLLWANGKTLPRGMWFSHEEGTSEVVASCQIQRGDLSVEAAADRVRQFVDALPEWSDAIAMAERAGGDAKGIALPPISAADIPPDGIPGPGLIFVRV